MNNVIHNKVPYEELEPASATSMFMFPTTTLEIRDIICSLDSNKTGGLDKVTSRDGRYKTIYLYMY